MAGHTAGAAVVVPSVDGWEPKTYLGDGVHYNPRHNAYLETLWTLGQASDRSHLTMA